MLRGIRGATTVERNDAGQITERTRELLRLLVERNGVRPQVVASAIFTVTGDLDAAFPAVAAPRETITGKTKPRDRWQVTGDS